MLKKDKKSRFIRIFWILFYFLIFCLLVRGGFSYLDPDFGWHLKVGQEISLSGQVPSVNLYNDTYTGNWVDHEWLSNLALYNFYNFAGYEAIVVIFALLILVTLILLNWFFSKHTKYKLPLGINAALQLLAVLAAMPHFGVRLQELALLFTLLVLIILNDYERRKRKLTLLFLPPLFFLWANLHASFLIGLFLLAAFIAIKISERLLFRLSTRYKFWSFIDFSKLMERRDVWYLFLGWLSAFSVTMLTPYKLNLYSFLIGYKNKAYLRLIQEWLPQYVFPFHYDQLICLALGAAALLFYIYYRLKEHQGLEIWPVFLTVLFLFLSFQSRRHFPLFFIASFGFMMEAYGRLFIDTPIIKDVYYKWIKHLIFICLALVIIFEISEIKPVSSPFNAFCNNYPCAAIDFLDNNPQYLNSHLFNSYGWGGFLIHELPSKKIFIDGRLPQVEFAGKTFIQEYYSFFDTDSSPEIKLKEYNIGAVLIKIKDKPVKAKRWEKVVFMIKDEDLITVNRLKDYLDEASDWKVVYEDEVSRIYVRTFSF